MAPALLPQPDASGKAKPYQARQLVALAERFLGRLAMAAWLEAQVEGRPVPEPCYRPAIHACRHAA